MGNPKGWIEAHAKKLLQNRREQNGVTVVEQIVQPAASPLAGEFILVQAAPKDLPEHLRANGFLVDAVPGFIIPQLIELGIVGRNMFRQQKLVPAFGIHRLLPEALLGCRLERDDRP